MKRGVFLDRDGVINESVIRGKTPHPPESVSEFKLLPGVPEACDRLRRAGFLLAVITNQPDVARGAQTRDRVEEINDLVRRALPVEDVLTCYHDDADFCDCRKPKPGLLFRAAQRWDIDLSKSYMVGDRWRDIEAGRAAGCASLLVARGYSESSRCRPDWVVDGLPQAVEIIIGEERYEKGG